LMPPKKKKQHTDPTELIGTAVSFERSALLDNVAESVSTIMIPDNDNTVVKCPAEMSTADSGVPPPEAAACFPCSCFRPRKLYASKSANSATAAEALETLGKANQMKRVVSSLSLYQDADDGHGVEMVSGLFDDAASLDASQCYFDALQEEIAADEEIYPIITTNYKRKAPKVSMSKPQSMLRLNHPETPKEIDIVMSSAPARGEVGDSDITRRRSVRFNKLLRRSSVETKKSLQEPRVKIEERGYPGGLDMEELATAVSTTSIWSKKKMCFGQKNFSRLARRLTHKFFDFY
jgi:hypothetical protein